MLSQVNHWMEFVGAGIDVLLLLRVLTLKLHRTYLFITLACVLQVFFDAVLLWLGADSEESRRVFFYSKFLYAIVFPAAAWDVFEELKAQLANLRKMAISRTITSLLLVIIFGLVLAGFAESGNGPNDMAFLSVLSLVVWTGSATGSLAFLWVMHRGMRAQKLQPPNNTFVWLIFFELSLIGEVLYCFYLLVEPIFNPLVADILILLLMLYGTVITAWCILKLKALPSDIAQVRTNDGSAV
jgi:hypothetical protein